MPAPDGDPDLEAALAPHQQLLSALHITPRGHAPAPMRADIAFDPEIGVTTDNASEGVW